MRAKTDARPAVGGAEGSTCFYPGDQDHSRQRNCRGRCDPSFSPPEGNGGISCPVGTRTGLQVKQLGESSSLVTKKLDFARKTSLLLKTNTFTYSKSICLMRNEHKMYFLHYGIAACAAANTLPCPCFQGGQIRGLRSHLTQENTGAKKNTCWAKTICEPPKKKHHTPKPIYSKFKLQTRNSLLYCRVQNVHTYLYDALCGGGGGVCKTFSQVQSCTSQTARYHYS